MPGSASYPQGPATVAPSPVSIVARKAVSTPPTPCSTLKPCLPRNSESQAQALTSWYASSGLSWIFFDRVSSSSARRSTACEMASLTVLIRASGGERVRAAATTRHSTARAQLCRGRPKESLLNGADGPLSAAGVLEAAGFEAERL